MMRDNQHIDWQPVAQFLQENPFRFRLDVTGLQDTPSSTSLDANDAGGIVPFPVTARIRVQHGKFDPVPPPMFTSMALQSLAHRQEFRDAGFHIGNR